MLLLKQKAAAAAKGKAAAQAQAKAGKRGQAGTRISRRKQKADAAAKQKRCRSSKGQSLLQKQKRLQRQSKSYRKGIHRSRSRRTFHQPINHFLDKYIKVIEEHLGKDVLEDYYINNSFKRRTNHCRKKRILLQSG